MVDPTKIPMTTHNRRPKIEVGFDSSEFTNVASYTDIVSTDKRERERDKGFCGVL